jgi:hypothetical protein
MGLIWNEQLQEYTAPFEFLTSEWAGVNYSFEEWWNSLTEQEQIIVGLKYVQIEYGSSGNFWNV